MGPRYTGTVRNEHSAMVSGRTPHPCTQLLEQTGLKDLTPMHMAFGAEECGQTRHPMSMHTPFGTEEDEERGLKEPSKHG